MKRMKDKKRVEEEEPRRTEWHDWRQHKSLARRKLKQIRSIEDAEELDDYE